MEDIATLLDRCPNLECIDLKNCKAKVTDIWYKFRRHSHPCLRQILADGYDCCGYGPLSSMEDADTAADCLADCPINILGDWNAQVNEYFKGMM